MKSKRLSFEIKFHKRSRHWVSVHLHSSRGVMRGLLTMLSDHESAHTNACCWQAKQPSEDQCVAEIHFARDFLTLANIAHESQHAAYHRAVLIGIPLEDDEFQEYVSEDTGTLTDAIMAILHKNKVPVRYQLVPGRRLI